MNTIYSVEGYNTEDAPDETYVVLMSSKADPFPSEDDGPADLDDADVDVSYYDEDIHYYGVTEHDIQQAINNKTPLGDFIPISYVVVEHLSVPASDAPLKEIAITIHELNA